MLLYTKQKSYPTNTVRVDRSLQQSWRIKPELKKALEITIQRGKQKQ